MTPCISAADLERHVSGTLPEAEEMRVREHLEHCAACRGKLVRSDSDDAALIDEIRRAAAPTTVVPAGPTFPVRAPAQPREPADGTPNGKRDAAQAIGAAIEGYEIIRELGRGGMGIVYEAHQVKLNRKVALKVLPAMPGAINREAVDRFRHEATAAGKLHHTNIVPIYDFGQSGHLYYYAMELVEGRPLSEMIRRFAEANAVTASPTDLAELIHGTSIAQAETLAPGDEPRPSTRSGASRSGSGTTGHGRVYFRQVAHWMADAADALHYAHSQKIIHRDIKPGNLLLSHDGRIMILDFGLAKSSSELSFTKTGSLLGTLRYMSPEQAMAKRMNVDHRTDIYSLGATMYELLTFQPPFHGSDDKEILGQIITREPTPLRKIVPHVPRELETICLKTLEKAANRRYATAKDMADDLRRYSQDLPIVARPVRVVGRAMKFVRRRKALSVAVLSIGLLAATAAFAFTFAERAKREGEQRHQAQERERSERLEKFVTEGVRCIQTKAWLDAEQAFGEALLIDPADYRALVNLAIVKRYRYEQSKDKSILDGATALVERAIETRKDGFDAWNLKGVLLRTSGQLESAAEAHRRACELNTSYYANWVSLANLQAILGNVEDAEASLMKAVGLPEADRVFMAQHNLAAVQLRLGSTEALTTLDKALSLAESGGEKRVAKLLEAKAYLQLDGHVDAKRARDAAITAHGLVDSGGVDARTSCILALAYLRNENWEDAANHARRVVETDDEHAYALLVLAIAEAELSRAASAIGASEESDAADNAAVLAASARGHLRDAEAALRLRERSDRPHREANADQGLLWFETTEEIQSLMSEAKAALPDKPT